MSENKLTRTLIGKAISTKMDKTVTVLVERKVKHTIGKIVVKSKKYHVHDELAMLSVYRIYLRLSNSFCERISFGLSS